MHIRKKKIILSNFRSLIAIQKTIAQSYGMIAIDQPSLELNELNKIKQIKIFKTERN